ncbi:hypothetical protein [Phenylobacterium sp.]|nr:hypothetical protein [Phenylobacterium sp.]
MLTSRSVAATGDRQDETAWVRGHPDFAAMIAQGVDEAAGKSVRKLKTI